MIAIDGQKCTGCKTCANVCPHGVIEVQNKKALASHEERCVECGACQLNCDDGAIEVTKGTGCLYISVKEDILKIRPQGKAA